MSLLIKNKHNNKNKKSLSTSLSSIIVKTKTTNAAASAAARTKAITKGITTTTTKTKTLHKYPTTITTTTTTITSTPLLSPSVEAATSTFDVDSSSARSLLSMMELAQVTEVGESSSSLSSGSFGRKVFWPMPSFKIMSCQNFIALLTVLVCGLVSVNGLKCYMCGEYNEGVGSITPCLNYSEQYAHLYLKECSKKSEKYCVKYVSELSIVRDCATECAEKEIWETQTYCCTEDGCNGSSNIGASSVVVMLPLVIFVVNEMMNILKQQRR